MPKKVLVIDDDADLVAALRTALELAGFQVEAAYSGAEGLARARQVGPDAIILDVTMETMGAGFKVARQLREEAGTRDTPLIMLTSINASDVGLRYGADEDWNPVDVFLDKPVPADRLVEEVRKVLGESRP